MASLAACAGGETANSGSTGGVPSAASSGASDGASGKACLPAASYDNPSGTFTFAYTTEPRSFDPNKVGSGSDLIFLRPVFDRLLLEDSQGKILPGLAESWKVSDDGRKISLTLRPDLKFHDGTPINGQAVAANLDHARSLDGGFSTKALAPITSIEVVSDREVSISIKEGAVSVTTALAGAAGMMISPNALSLDPVEMAKVGGSGGFKLESFQSGAEARYTRIADYWDKESYGFSDLVIPIIGDANARLNALITGAIDATLGSETLNKAAEEKGLESCTQSVVSAAALNLNTSRAEFGDPRVRQAMNYAIDREGIAEVIYGGLCEPNSQRFPSWFRAANPDIKADHYAYDPEKAKALMDEAGVDGFSFDMHTPADVGIYPKLAEVLKQQWGEIGINANIVPSELHAILEAFRVSESSDAHLAPLVTTEPVAYLESFYLKDGLNNPGGYEAAGMQDLFTQLRAAKTAEEQEPLFAKVAQLAVDETYPQVVICNSITSYIANDRVGGLEIAYDNSRDFRTVTIKE